MLVIFGYLVVLLSVCVDFLLWGCIDCRCFVVCCLLVVACFMLVRVLLIVL